LQQGAQLGAEELLRLEGSDLGARQVPIADDFEGVSPIAEQHLVLTRVSIPRNIDR
jgi:hypothetical protein